MRFDENDAEKVLSNMVDLPTLLTNAPKFNCQGEIVQFFKSYERFQAYTSEGVMAMSGAQRSLKAIQIACCNNNTYVLLNSGIIYATGANDRWQCSEIEEAVENIKSVEREANDTNEERGFIFSSPVFPRLQYCARPGMCL